jgi:hypothetical protein
MSAAEHTAGFIEFERFIAHHRACNNLAIECTGVRLLNRLSDQPGV